VIFCLLLCTFGRFFCQKLGAFSVKTTGHTGEVRKEREKREIKKK